MTYYGINQKPNSLKHHQVRFAKWGVMHGPPYPLSGENKAKAKADYKKNRKENSKADRKTDTRKTDTEKTDRKTDAEQKQTIVEIKEPQIDYKKEADALQNQINYYQNQDRLNAILNKRNENKGSKFVQNFGKAVLDDVIAPAAKAVAKDWVENKLRDVTNTPKQKQKQK